MSTAMYVMACTTDPAASAGSCPSPVWLQYSDLTSFAVSQLDPVTIATAFGAGFVIPATAFLIGRSVSVVLSMIGR